MKYYSTVYKPFGLGLKEAANLIGVSKRTMQRLQQEGEIPFSRIGRKIIFRLSQLEAYLKRKEAENVR